VAHITRRFAWRIAIPVVGIAILVVSAASVTACAITISPLLRYSLILAVVLLAWVCVVLAMCLVYRKSVLPPGDYMYVFGREPALWHRKMGALWILEKMVTRRGRLRVYRKLGADIGPIVLAGYITDPELAQIGRSAVVGGGSRVLTHAIEARNGALRLVLDHVEIGEGAVIGSNAVLLPGSKVRPGSTVPACHVVPKGRMFPEGI